LLTINVGRAIKGSKDVVLRLFFQKMEQQLSFGPRARLRKPKMPKPTPNMTSPTKNSNPKLPNFLVETRRLSESFEGLNNSLVQWSLNFFARAITQ